tara:strand:+ start:194 stop:553 length:360 start_codon:yes stop_codon:yes gene_type:complete
MSPVIQMKRSFTNEPQLQLYLKAVYDCEQYDSNGVYKIKYYMKNFFMNYASTYAQKEKLPKLMKRKKKIMKYLHNVKFRLPNDVELSHRYDESVLNIENILDNHIFKAYKYHNESYFVI